MPEEIELDVLNLSSRSTGTTTDPYAHSASCTTRSLEGTNVPNPSVVPKPEPAIPQSAVLNYNWQQVVL